MTLVSWFFLLVLQNAAFTWVSRARNSGSLWYHAQAAVFSNGIFFVTNIILIGFMTRFMGDPNRTDTTLYIFGGVYVAGTVTGSVLMHYVSMRWLEAGKRKVGA